MLPVPDFDHGPRGRLRSRNVNAWRRTPPLRVLSSRHSLDLEPALGQEFLDIMDAEGKAQIRPEGHASLVFRADRNILSGIRTL